MTANDFITANVERFSGLAETYDRYRPAPPAVFVDVLTQLAQTETPSLVVDLGCGTGLSTRIWANCAQQVIGIEPNDDMRRAAEARTTAPNVHYRRGFSTATSLREASADIIIVSQALHWMEPEPTLQEVARVLRVGGVFAAIDCDWPPVIHWEVEAAYNVCMQQVATVNRAYGLAQDIQRWAKREHLVRMEASGYFRYVREIVLHGVEMGDAGRLVGLALSQGHVATPLKHGISEGELGITRLREVAQRVLGDSPRPWYFSYRVRLGIK